jgi:large subunit ribosomal protein L37Ae
MRASAIQFVTMADNNRSSGSAGRFGTRYGRVSRRRVSEIEADMEAATCPDCDGDADRQGTGMWECNDCGQTFTGGAYSPQTPAGRTVDRSIRAALTDEDE